MAAKKQAKKDKASARKRKRAAPAVSPESMDQATLPAMPVVGICASAGGLDAFKGFFAAMPSDSGMAFVLVPHLDPNQESMLAGLLARCTAMPVIEAREGMKLAANHVYVIPPNKYMQICAGILHLTVPPSRHAPPPFDALLRSLAESQEDKAVGIILSGTGAHGLQGVRAIKAHGGLILAQDPQTAEYDSMPQAAIATGLVDFVLPVAEMPAELTNFSRSYIGPVELRSNEDVIQELNDILRLILANAGHDFRRYRKQTLLRRITRRMSLNRIGQLQDFRAFLLKHPLEVNQLVKDLLINVTAFFRDAEVFQLLGREVVPELLERMPQGEPVRVWVPGCATGEEAYSIAILLIEQIENAQQDRAVRIFATDLNEEAVEIARLGIYANDTAGDLSAERMARFFVKLDEHRFQASRELRGCITFAMHDLLRDTPFAKLHLISCRNLLIYIKPEVQQEVLALFHFALVDGGFLVLGPSETIGPHGDLFEPVSKRWRVFRRIGVSRLDRVNFVQRSLGRPITGLPARRDSEADLSDLKLGALVQRALLEHCAPAAVLVNRAKEILYYYGPTSRYLQHPAGQPTQSLIAMTREGLRAKLRTALNQAAHEERRVVIVGGRVRRNGRYVPVRITVIPLQHTRTPTGPLLIVFEDEPFVEHAESSIAESKVDSSVVRQLETELRGTREELQDTIEDLENANEGLKASNEEVTSMNEELQSANEELETSKEELQSLNEELTTVNSELQDKLQELGVANDDITNLLNSTDLAAIFLGTGLHIRRFTPSATGILNLLATDVGRPVGDIQPKFHDPAFQDDARKVLHDSSSRENEVQTEDGRWFVRRTLPYRTADNLIDGVVVTFSDVTLLKQLNEALEVKVADRTKALSESEERFRIMADGTPVPIWILDAEGRIEFVNRAYCEFFGTTLDAAKSQVWQTIIHPEDAAEYNAAFAAAARDHRPCAAQVRVRRHDGQWRWIVSYGQPRISSSGEFLGMAGSNPDITERIEMEEALRERELRLSAILSAAPDAIITIDKRGRIDSVNQATERIFGYTAAELVGQNVALLMPPPYREEHDRYLADYLRTGVNHILGISREVLAQRKDGTTFPVDLAVSELVPLQMFTAILRDISSRKYLEREVVEIALLEQRRVGRELHDECGQELTGLSLMADHLVQSLSKDATADGEIANKVRQGIERLMQFVRNLAHGLAQTEITPAQLSTALAELASRLDDPPRRRCVAECDRHLAVEDEIKATHLYHIAQEACTNAVKHSQARNVHIRIRSGGDAVVLQIVDDGVGMSGTRAGLGLRIMRTRASTIGAELTIEPVQPQGTSVTCTLPTNRRQVE